MPRCSSFLAKIMTALLCHPQKRSGVQRRPPMPYREWESQLRRRVQSWYRAVSRAEEPRQVRSPSLHLHNTFSFPLHYLWGAARLPEVNFIFSIAPDHKVSHLMLPFLLLNKLNIFVIYIFTRRHVISVFNLHSRALCIVPPWFARTYTYTHHTHTRAHTHTQHTHSHARTHARTYTYTYTCTYTHTAHTHSHMCTHSHTHTHTHTHSRTHIHIHTPRTHSLTHAHTHIHTHTHTHTRTHAHSRMHAHSQTRTNTLTHTHMHALTNTRNRGGNTMLST